ncbi:MAG: hypothetical protein IT437_10760 [Phycisphaerales bacterium]|nr:hypothetical protein [Phycisphaerales bacterium]
MAEGTIHLSPAGIARRDAILGGVLAASRSRRRRRAVARGAALAVPVIALGATVWAVRSAPAPAAPSPVVVGTPTPTIRLVATEAGIAERWASRASPASVERLDDDDLFLILRSEGRATGLIRTEGRVTVVGLQPDETPKPRGMAPEPRHRPLL